MHESLNLPNETDTIRQRLQNTFKQQLGEWTAQNPADNSWVVPFYYYSRHEAHRQIGGLWILAKDTQASVNYAGHLIHYALLQDMENGVNEFGLQLPALSSFYSKIIFENAEPTIYVGDMFSSSVRAQVEIDFDVRLTRD